MSQKKTNVDQTYFSLPFWVVFDVVVMIDSFVLVPVIVC